MTTPIELPAVEARKTLGRLMNRAYYRGEQFVIKRDDVPMVKIVPIWEDEEQDAARERVFQFVDELREKLDQQDPDEVDATFAEALEYAKQVD